MFRTLLILALCVCAPCLSAADLLVPSQHATIQAALNAAQSGDRVFIANGNYAVDSLQVTTSGITIEGESRAGVVISPGSVDSKELTLTTGTPVYGFVIVADNISISKLTINGEANNTALAQPADDNNFRVGIWNPRSALNHNIDIDAVDVRACVHSGISLGTFDVAVGRAMGHSVTNSSVTDITFSTGIAVSGECQIDGCTVEYVGLVDTTGSETGMIGSVFDGQGIKFDCGPATISNNSVSHFSRFGIGNVGNTMHGNNVFQIYGNTVSDILFTPVAYGWGAGIALEGPDGDTTVGGVAPAMANTLDLGTAYLGTHFPMHAIAISSIGDDQEGQSAVLGNTIDYYGRGHGLYVRGARSSNTPLLIKDNKFDYIRAGTQQQMELVQGNSIGIYLTDSDDSYHHLTIHDPQDVHAVIEGNTIDRFANSIALGTSRDAELDVTIREGNIAMDAGSALVVSDSSKFDNSFTTDLNDTTVRILKGGLEVDDINTAFVISGAVFHIDGIDIKNAALGVNLSRGAHLATLRDCDFTNTPIGIFLFGAVTTGTIAGNDFSDCTTNAIETGATGTPPVSPATVYAGGNYWGHASGPTHPSNPSGQGVPIEGDVSFTPFMTTPLFDTQITSTPVSSVVAESPYSYLVTTAGVNVNIAVSGLPGWLSYHPVTKVISGTPQLSDVGLSQEIRIEAIGDFGPDDVQTFQIDVTAAAPTFTSAVPASPINAGAFFSHTFTTSGSPAPTLSATVLPSWMSFNNVDTITGTPPVSEVGNTVQVSFTASNGFGQDAVQTFGLEIYGESPQLLSLPVEDAEAGAHYLYTLVIAGVPTPMVSVTGLPAWLSFDGNTQISGTPPAGTHGPTSEITVSVDNGIGAPVVQTFVIDVTNPARKTSGGGGGGCVLREASPSLWMLVLAACGLVLFTRRKRSSLI